jgi:hypothetical protein
MLLPDDVVSVVNAGQVHIRWIFVRTAGTPSRRGRQREDYQRWERSPGLRHGTPPGVLFPVRPVGRAHPAGTVAFGAITEHPLDPTLTFADLAPHRVPVTTMTLRPVVPTHLQLHLIVIGFWL